MVDSLFLGIAVLTIVSAIAALEMRSLIYGGIALMGTLGGIAGFFILLDSPFVALFQIAVYVGSIAVLILFTIMLVKNELIFQKKEDPKRRYAGIALMLILMISLGAVIFNSGLSSITTEEPPVDYKEIGEDFLIYYWPALIAMALVLSGSITGAMILARKKMSNELIDFVIVSVALLAIGIYGLSVKRNFIRMLFAIEIIINAANLNLVAFARFLPHSGGQTFALFSIAIAAAEVAVGLALIIVAYRMYKNIDVADFRSLKG